MNKKYLLNLLTSLLSFNCVLNSSPAEEAAKELAKNMQNLVTKSIKMVTKITNPDNTVTIGQYKKVSQQISSIMYGKAKASSLKSIIQKSGPLVLYASDMNNFTLLGHAIGNFFNKDTISNPERITYCKNIMNAMLDEKQPQTMSKKLVNYPVNSGSTPLIFAIKIYTMANKQNPNDQNKQSLLQIIKQLKKHAVNVNIKDASGKIALDYTNDSDIRKAIKGRS